MNIKGVYVGGKIENRIIYALFCIHSRMIFFSAREIYFNTLWFEEEKVFCFILKNFCEIELKSFFEEV